MSFIESLMRRIAQPPDTHYIFIRGDRVDLCSYADLIGRALAIAALLRQHGHHVTSDNRAILFFNHAQDFIPALMACLYSEIIAVPLNLPRSRAQIQRLRYIIADARPTLVLTNRHRVDDLTTIIGLRNVPVICVEDVTGVSASIPTITARRSHPGSSLEPMFIQYTSGSTGNPKGVVITDSNLTSNLESIISGTQYGAHEYGVSWLPHYHDLGLIGGVFLALHTATPWSFMDPMVFLRNPLRWLSEISERRATISSAPNFAYDLCARAAEHAEFGKLDLASWRLAITGAEPVRMHTLERFANSFACYGFRHNAFWPAYGLAEATLLVSHARAHTEARTLHVKGKLAPDSRVELSEISGEGTRCFTSCGTAAKHVDLVIVDHAGTALPMMHVGEIAISGIGITPGYWHGPDSPPKLEGLLDIYGRRFFRTGDHGFMADGELFVCGRSKDLIIVNGRNIYSEDIESAVLQKLAEFDVVYIAAVAVDSYATERVAVIVEKSNGGMQSEERYQLLADVVRTTIVENFSVIPAEVVIVRRGAIPKTPSGKVQRQESTRLLNAQAFNTVYRCRFVDGDLDEPMGIGDSKDEIDLARIRAELALGNDCSLRTALNHIVCVTLGFKETMDNNQSLVSLGIDSLGYIQLVMEVETELGVSITHDCWYEDPTFGQMLDQIKVSLQSDPLPKPPGSFGKPAHRSLELPVTYNQHRALFLETLRPQERPPMLLAAVALTQGVDAARLGRSLRDINHLHDAFRIQFARRGDGFFLRTAPEGGLILNQVDCPAPAGQVLDNLRSGAAMFDKIHGIIRAFDRAPLGRITLLMCGDGASLLAISVHHAIFDGLSAAIFMRHLQELYGAKQPQSVLNRLRPICAPYSEYAAFEPSLLSNDKRAALISFWRGYLAGSANITNGFSNDQAFTPLPCAIAHVELDEQMVHSLRHLCACNELTPHIALLGCFQLALAATNGVTDVRTATPTANRQPRFVNTLGFFVNPVIVRNLLVDPDITAVQSLLSLRHSAAQSYRHGGLPLRHIVDALCPSIVGQCNPLFDSWFSIQVSISNGKVAEELGWKIYNLPTGDLRVAHALELIWDGDRLVGKIAVTAGSATANMLASNFMSALDAVFSKRQVRIRDLLENKRR